MTSGTGCRCAILCGLAGAGLGGAWERSPYLGRAALGIAAAALVTLMARTNWPLVDVSGDMTPYVYARRNLEAVEPNALIVSDYDGRTFSLWFYKATEFKKSHPHLAVVYKSLLIWDWYRYHIAKRYPGLVSPSGPPDANLMLNRIVARNVKNRPVYLARRFRARVPLRIEPVGYSAPDLSRPYRPAMTGTLRAFLHRRGTVLLTLAILAVTAFHAGRMLKTELVVTGGGLSLPLDDSFIYLQYARAIAQGHPFVYTPGNAPTTGATSLGYPLLLLPPHLLGLPPSIAIAWALALGVVGFAASALLMVRLGRRLGGWIGGGLALALFLASAQLLWGYMSGMEVPLYATVLLAST
jgi:hypothetical protein